MRFVAVQFRNLPMHRALLAALLLALPGLTASSVAAEADQVFKILEHHCFDCHDDATKKSGFNLEKLLDERSFDGTLMFENLLSGKMPPATEEQLDAKHKRAVLDWLAKRQAANAPNSFRRISRYEFVHSVNDLLGTELAIANRIPEDRGTNDFDSNQKIQLSREMLGAYFTVADEMLEQAFPARGFPAEKVWVTHQIKDSHETYRIYNRPYLEGILFSWTRANNGNNYSFFYDNFDPPVAGWYDLTFDAMKVAEFGDDVSLQVYAGKYYYADDRPQPQRLVGVISLGNKELKSHTLRTYLNPGENVSVHCYSRHNFRHQDPKEGAYIKQLKVRGPVLDQWPPLSYPRIFGDLPVKAEPRNESETHVAETNLRKIDGKAATSISETQRPTPRSNPLDHSNITVASTAPEDLKKVIRRFSERAFSSKLSDAELAPYFLIGQRQLEDHGDFVQATKEGLKAILCSPRFLMAPGEHVNPSYAKAAGLARTLWLAVPDEELLRIAAEDRLAGKTLPAQIDRMLLDSRSHRMIRSFCDQWLNLRSLNKVTPSLKLYPEYDDLLSHYLPIETRLYVDYLIKENLPAGKLIESDFAFLNQRLARHYGIEGVIGQEMRKVTFPPGVPRGGLLTMGSVLQVTTDGFYTSPILRGAWISKNIVGIPLSPPPKGIPALEPEHGKPETLKEQIEKHKSNKSCYACHKSIDPYGFGLESFDATGQWRERYKVMGTHSSTFIYRPEGYYQMGNAVDASGEIGKDQFDDIVGLKKILVSDERHIAYNFAKKFFEYASGNKPDLEQRLHLWDFIARNPGNTRLKDLVTEVLILTLTSKDP